MTTEEKRMKLFVFCAERACGISCPLYQGFRCGEGVSFTKKWSNGNYCMADSVVERAYSKVFEKKKAPPKKRSNPAAAIHDCPHNCGVQCDSPDSQCAGCGWNTSVDENRRARLKYIFQLPTNRFALYGLRLKKKKA